MSIWESVGTTYLEAVSTAIPFQRIIIFGAGFIGSIAVENQQYLSIFESIARIPFAQLIDLSSGVLAKATIADALVGIGLAFSGWCLHRISTWTIFLVAAKVTELWDKVSKSTSAHEPAADLTIEARKQILDLIDTSLSESKSRLRSLSSGAELLGGGAIGFLVASYWGNALDALIGTAFLLGAIAAQVASVRTFLAEYFGHALYRAQLLGKPAPRP